MEIEVVVFDIEPRGRDPEDHCGGDHVAGESDIRPLFVFHKVKESCDVMSHLRSGGRSSVVVFHHAIMELLK